MTIQPSHQRESPVTPTENTSGKPEPTDPHDARATAGTGAHPATVESTLPVVGLLDQTGARVRDSRFSPWIEDLGRQEIEEIYRSMLRARRLDEMATSLQRQGQMVLWPPLRGQEAAQVASARALETEDYVFPSYREHAVILERGIPAEAMMTQFRGHTASSWKPSETRTQIYSLVLGAQVPHAVGYAMGITQDQKLAAEEGQNPPPEAAVLVYYGDGASTEGEVHESMVFAASYDAPVVFFVQNNQWAISVPFSTQSRVPLATRAAGYGFEGVRVDGNDPLAVLAVTRWALAEARQGRGPVMIEAETFRLGAHTTADDPTKYRRTDEEQLWAPRDPLLRTRNLLEREYGAEDVWFQGVEDETSEWIKATRSGILAGGPVDLEQRFDVVYATDHPLVAEERRWYRDYRDSFVEEENDDAADASGSRGTGREDQA
ncbi:pyruvate dehydrogenase (acetyl-transferring) E1 component subunit alpha [Kocuria sp. JC486]|nr:pyruvate dehydrogenase (acetyl-transferring) E1 component subunit alpha [Kocuria sp. JC486]